MALIRGQPWRMYEDLPVNGTQHHPYYQRMSFVKGGLLFLVRVKDNGYDPNAVAVCVAPNDLSTQVGWVPMSKSLYVAEHLDSRAQGYYKVTVFNKVLDHTRRLRGDLFIGPLPGTYEPEHEVTLGTQVLRGVDKSPNLPDEVVISHVGALSQDPAAIAKLYSGGKGAQYDLRTTDTRSSVSVYGCVDGRELAWFRKSELSDDVIVNLCQYRAVRLGHDEDGIIKLVRQKILRQGLGKGKILYKTETDFGLQPPGPIISQEAHMEDLIGYQQAAINQTIGVPASMLVADEVPDTGFDMHTQHPWPAKQALSAALEAARKQYQPPQKEDTMNTSTISTAITATIAANKSAATQAGYMEAGRLANNQFANLASKHLPFMLRGYADTAFGKLVLANVAALAAKQLRPEDATLAKLTEAMAVQAFQEIYQTVDIEGMLNGMLSSPEMKSAIDKLPKDAPAAPAPRETSY